MEPRHNSHTWYSLHVPIQLMSEFLLICHGGASHLHVNLYGRLDYTSNGVNFIAKIETQYLTKN